MTEYLYQALERDLLSIVADVRAALDTAEAEEVQMYLTAGEFGLALETICAVLTRKRAPVAAATYVNISDVGARLDVEPSWWLDMAVV